MNKADLAQYLVNLHTLMAAQASGIANPSQTLAAEYERGWAELKSIIEDEQKKGSKK